MSRRVQVNRDICRRAFFLDNDMIRGLRDDGFDLGHRVTLRHDEPRGIGADVLVLLRRQNHFLGATGIRALAEEVVRRILLTEGVGDLANALVHVPEERLVHRQPFLLRLVHGDTVAR